MEEFKNIANYLLLKSSNIHNVGLYHGKMGIVLTLYLYSKYYNETIFQDFAWDLLQDVYCGVNHGMPIGLEEGLAGIAYGITLLRKADLIDADLNNILWEVDSKIMDYDPRRIKDFSFKTGAFGLIDYIKLRITTDSQILSLDEQYLKELQHSILEHHTEIEETNFISNLKSPEWKVNEYIDHELGIDNGCSYFIIKELYDKIFSDK